MFVFVYCFAESHTAERLYEFYMDVFREYAIEDKIISATTDNGANFVASVNNDKTKDKWAPIRCFIHTLQLAVHDVLKVF